MDTKITLLVLALFACSLAAPTSDAPAADAVPEVVTTEAAAEVVTTEAATTTVAPTTTEESVPEAIQCGIICPMFCKLQGKTGGDCNDDGNCECSTTKAGPGGDAWIPDAFKPKTPAPSATPVPNKAGDAGKP